MNLRSPLDLGVTVGMAVKGEVLVGGRRRARSHSARICGERAERANRDSGATPLHLP